MMELDERDKKEAAFLYIDIGDEEKRPPHRWWFGECWELCRLCKEKCILCGQDVKVVAIRFITGRILEDKRVCSCLKDIVERNYELKPIGGLQ